MTHSTEDHIIRSIDDLKQTLAGQTKILTKIQVDVATLKTHRETMEKTLEAQSRLIADHEKSVQRAYGWSKGAVWVAGVLSVAVPFLLQYLSVTGK